MTPARETAPALQERIVSESLFVNDLLAEINKVIVGQEKLVERVLAALLADGHVLLEGADLLPADLIGTQVYNPQLGVFSIHRGPLFTNLLLADEINRAPAKVQSALLEAMQERQVTIASKTDKLPDLFMVMQADGELSRAHGRASNARPHDGDGTSACPRGGLAGNPPARAPTHETGLCGWSFERLYFEFGRRDAATRRISDGAAQTAHRIRFGASPRAGIFLIEAARAHAFLHGRGYVIPDDVKEVAPDVLRHRVLTSYEAEAENITSDEIVKQVLAQVQVP
jgi:MoxR-like ATPase